MKNKFIIIIITIIISYFIYNFYSENSSQITSNSNSIKETNSLEINKTNSFENIILNGIYIIDASDVKYEFESNGNVTYSTNKSEFIGNYTTIGENKLEIHFTKQYIWDDITLTQDINNIDKIEKISVIDENTLNIEFEENNEIKSYNITKFNYSNNLSDSTKTPLYVFESANRQAANGNPEILNIFELNDNIMDFDYNHGWDFETNTITRIVSGTAIKTEENQYEFSEIIYNNEYKIIFEYSTEKVMLQEYSNGELISTINLWS